VVQVEERVSLLQQIGLFQSIEPTEPAEVPMTTLERAYTVSSYSVISKDQASAIVPFSVYDSEDPEDLWNFLASYEQRTGGEVLALAHNGNLSNGLMFDDVTFTTREPLSRDYAHRRQTLPNVGGCGSGYETRCLRGDVAHLSTDSDS